MPFEAQPVGQALDCQGLWVRNLDTACPRVDEPAESRCSGLRGMHIVNNWQNEFCADGSVVRRLFESVGSEVLGVVQSEKN